jgi:2'-5' RNA ligase
MRPNWFFAFPLDGAFLDELPPPPANIRPFHPSDVHLTLAFLGRCGRDAAERALAVLDARLAQSPRPPLAVSLAGVVPMGARRSYTALSALLDRGRNETESYITTVRDPLFDAAHTRRDQRRPKAHVTLARPTRRATDAQRLAGIAWAEALDLRPIQRTLDRIALYTWADDRPRRMFKVVAERPLMR